MMTDSITIKMKSIFKTINEFEDYLSNDLKLEGDFKIFIAPYVYYFFVNANICYDTIEAFKRHLGITIKNIYKRYTKRHDLVEASYKLNTEDLAVTSKMVTILANNDNTQVLDPLNSVLEFVSQQNISQQEKNKLKAYLEALDTLSDDVIEEFIDELRKHFLTVLYEPDYLICTKEGK